MTFSVSHRQEHPIDEFPTTAHPNGRKFHPLHLSRKSYKYVMGHWETLDSGLSSYLGDILCGLAVLAQNTEGPSLIFLRDGLPCFSLHQLLIIRKLVNSVFLSLSLGVGIAQWYSAGFRAGWSGVPVLAGAGNFSLHSHVQGGSAPPPPASYPMGTRGSFPRSKAVGAWSWPLTSI
jgi:hypothetical protein